MLNGVSGNSLTPTQGIKMSPLKQVLGPIWAFYSLMLIGFVFTIDTNPWYVNTIWTVLIIFQLLTQEKAVMWLTTEDKEKTK